MFGIKTIDDVEKFSDFLNKNICKDSFVGSYFSNIDGPLPVASVCMESNPGGYLELTLIFTDDISKIEKGKRVMLDKNVWVTIYREDIVKLEFVDAL